MLLQVLILMALCAFAYAVLTFAFSTLAYAFFPIEINASSRIGCFGAFAALVGLWLLWMIKVRNADAGGMLIQLVLIATSAIAGGPVGCMLSALMIDRIKRRSIAGDDG